MIFRTSSKNGVRLFQCYFLLCLFFLWTPFLPAESKGEEVQDEIFSIGTGPIEKGNVALAKKKAISNALIKGVEDYLLRRLGSHGVINNFERLVRGVIPGAREEIENFHILAEENIGKKYKIFVRMKINKKVIDQRLRQAGLIHTEGPPIRVLFLVSETSEGAVSYWWNAPGTNPALTATELALFKIFQERGFIPINRTLTAPEVESFDELRSPVLEQNDILVLGRLFSADVVIHGQSEMADGKEIILTLAAYDVHKGNQLYEDTQTENIEGDPEDDETGALALERLTNRVAGQMAPALIQILSAERAKPQHLEITVRGIKTPRHIKEFRDFLREHVKGIESVTQSRVRKNSASFEVEFRGDKKSFLDNILNHKDSPFPLDFVETQNDQIVLTVVLVPSKDLFMP